VINTENCTSIVKGPIPHDHSKLLEKIDHTTTKITTYNSKLNLNNGHGELFNPDTTSVLPVEQPFDIFHPTAKDLRLRATRRSLNVDVVQKDRFSGKIPTRKVPLALEKFIANTHNNRYWGIHKSGNSLNVDDEKTGVVIDNESSQTTNGYGIPFLTISLKKHI